MTPLQYLVIFTSSAISGAMAGALLSNRWPHLHRWHMAIGWTALSVLYITIYQASK